MPVTDQIDAAGKAIKAIVAVIAIFPGMAYLTGIVELPASMVKTVTIIAFSVSAVVLLAVFQLGDWIRALSKRRAITYSVSAVLLGGLMVIGYSEVARRHVAIVSEPGQTAVISFVTPMFPSKGFLESMATPNPTTEDYAAAYEGAADPLSFRGEVDRESLWTRLIMYLLLLASQVLLVAPVVAAAWKLADTVTAQAARDAATSTKS
jgi:hypothetical protein